MLLTVSDFRQRVRLDMPALVDALQSKTNRYGHKEADAWHRSLPKLASFLDRPALQSMHLHVQGRGNLTLEYPLPGSSSWCDVVLLGQHDGRAAALVLELKDWMTRNDMPTTTTGLMGRHDGIYLHPSDQVRGYAQYCQRFHSAVLDRQASVSGAVMFTADRDYHAYLAAPNRELSNGYPLFSTERPGDDKRFDAFCSERLTAPDEAFAHAFESGTYRQDRGFIRQMGQQINHPVDSPFELLDNQRYAYAVAKAHVESAVLSDQPIKDNKKVIAIVGPPGSGKSVIAIKLWAALAAHENLPSGDLAFVTTSSSQNSNWTSLFDAIPEQGGAAGIVKKASSFHPLTMKYIGVVKKKYEKGFFNSKGSEWRQNLQKMRIYGLPIQSGAEDNALLVSVVDEAHGLVNTEHPDAVGPLGFPTMLGPQAYHIMRVSQVSIFLLDPEQGFRDRESTTLQNIESWAKELGVSFIDKVYLEGSQFRCAGSVEYVHWIDRLFHADSPSHCAALARTWRKQDEVMASTDASLVSPRGQPNAAEPGDAPQEALDEMLTGLRTLDFVLHDDPFTAELALRDKLFLGFTARWLSSYSRPWKTKEALCPHSWPDAEKDFYEPMSTDAPLESWSKIWNYVPKGSDYTLFVQGRGPEMLKDPLCEVGCPYAIRGFDLDYVGILWLEDLVWRSGRWVVDLNHFHETGNTRLKNRVKKEKDPNGPEHQALFKSVFQAYRILLTRAIRGVHVWIKDKETRDYVRACLSSR